MQKIPSLYIRDVGKNLRYVSRAVNPAAAWVIEEPENATPTLKWDGTCTMLDPAGQWWSRHQLRPGKTAPEVYVPVETDPITGKTQGWVPAERGNFRRQISEALDRAEQMGWEDFKPGTYELIGPTVQSNPHDWPYCTLIAHGTTPLQDVPTAFDALHAYCADMASIRYFEGVVWHHADGVRMAKIKTHDFDPDGTALL